MCTAIASRRKSKGVSDGGETDKGQQVMQKILVQQIGFSHPQIANLIHGRFGMSHQAAMTMHEVLEAQSKK